VHGDRDPSAGFADRDGDAPHLGGRQRLARVAQQVDERLPELRLVCRDLGQPRRHVHGNLDPGLRELAARHLDDRRDDRPDVLAFQLRARQPREAQVRLGDLGEAVHLADDRRDQAPRLFAALRDLVAQQLGVEPD